MHLIIWMTLVRNLLGITFFQLVFMLVFFRVLNDDFWRIPRLRIYGRAPPGSLPIQSTNFASHLLSYNKALINQLLGSMLKNIRTLALRIDLTPFHPYNYTQRLSNSLIHELSFWFRHNSTRYLYNANNAALGYGCL